MGHVSRFAAIFTGAMLLLACAARPTAVTTTFKDPATGPVRFRKAVAIFSGEDAQLRRQVENRLAARFPNATASHTLIPDEQLAAADTHSIRSTLTGLGFDGAVVFRLVSVESQGRGEAVPAGATPSEDLWAYVRRTPRAALAPGRQTVITMESRVYSVPDGKLLWAGLSETFNPLSIGELVNMIVDASLAEVRRQGLM